MEVEVRRPPGRVDRYRQELLLDEPDLKISLQIQPPDADGVPIPDGLTLGAGSILVWYLFPGRPYEIGAFHRPSGELVGHYVNVIVPVSTSGDRWVIQDLFLDIWIPPGDPPRVLDEEELEAGRRSGWITERTAEGARRACRGVLHRIENGDWPPDAVRRWPVDLIPALRLKRDSRGTYWAAIVTGRVIAYGLYVMGAASATSIGFAAFTDAFVWKGPSQIAWALTLLAEAIALLPLALMGRLPATRWPRPPLTDERSLFVATLASGMAVLALNERATWSGALLPVYGTLGLFSLIFAVCRAWFDRTVPVFALAGLAVTLVALAILL